MDEVKHDYCKGCKCWRLPSEFLNNKGRKLKTCSKCREYGRKHFKTRKKCEHGKIKSTCKECGGASICEHGRRRTQCKECGGGSLCEHGRLKNQCKECGGSAICEHGKRRTTCKECGGGALCEHGKIRSRCKECKGGSLCEHGRIRCTCKECGGASICEHGREKSKCNECDPIGYLRSIVSNRIRHALREDKSQKSIEYLGCSIQEFKEHIESQFQEGMTWDNYGEWHIDHIVPIMYETPTMEEVVERLHYLNTQPLWAEENMSKGNRFIG